MTPCLGVSPTVPSLQGADNCSEGEVLYELACRRVLSFVNNRMTIKRVILSLRLLVRVNQLLHRTKRWIPVSYAIGLACGTAVILVPSFSLDPSVRRWLGISSLAFGLPSHITAFLSLRYDMAVLVSHTFEFWYMMLLNLGATALLCAAMSDERVCALVSFSLAFQLAFCIYAIFRAHRVAIFVTAAGAFDNVGFLIALGFHAIPNINRIVLVSFHYRELTSDDIIANAVPFRRS